LEQSPPTAQNPEYSRILPLQAKPKILPPDKYQLATGGYTANGFFMDLLCIIN